MARSRNPARVVELAGTTYYWRVTPAILNQEIAVWPRDLPGSRLICVVPLSRVVAPALVRRVIELALASGYDPKKTRATLTIRLDPD